MAGAKKSCIMKQLGNSTNVIDRRKPLMIRKLLSLTIALALLLMPSAAAGNSVAVLSIAVYSVVVGAYAVLRAAKALRDRAAETDAAPAAELDLEAAAA